MLKVDVSNLMGNLNRSPTIHSKMVVKESKMVVKESKMVVKESKTICSSTSCLNL
jgi:hypothetical protein